MESTIDNQLLSEYNTAVHRQKAVTAYLKSMQLLPFDFAEYRNPSPSLSSCYV